MTSIPAHFDGEHILLNAPFDLSRDSKIVVTIYDEDDAVELERREWQEFALYNFARFYDDEPDIYSDIEIKEPNPSYIPPEKRFRPGHEFKYDPK